MDSKDKLTIEDIAAALLVVGFLILILGLIDMVP